MTCSASPSRQGVRHITNNGGAGPASRQGNPRPRTISATSSNDDSRRDQPPTPTVGTAASAAIPRGGGRRAVDPEPARTSGLLPRTTPRSTRRAVWDRPDQGTTGRGRSNRLALFAENRRRSARHSGCLQAPVSQSCAAASSRTATLLFVAWHPATTASRVEAVRPGVLLRGRKLCRISRRTCRRGLRVASPGHAASRSNRRLSRLVQPAVQAPFLIVARNDPTGSNTAARFRCA